MPITFTFDIDGTVPRSDDRARINLCFRHLGWESLGGSSWRYPALGTEGQEDWLNHVVPALALFRSLVLANELPVTAYTLDAQGNTGFRSRGSPTGSALAPASDIRLVLLQDTSESRNAKLSESRLRKLLAGLDSVSSLPNMQAR